MIFWRWRYSHRLGSKAIGRSATFRLFAKFPAPNPACDELQFQVAHIDMKVLYRCLVEFLLSSAVE